MNNAKRMSTGLKVFAWLMVLWNGIGVAAFFSQLMMTPEMIAQLPEAQQAVYRDIPVWSYAAYALAVFGGLIGSILLALGKKLALPVLVISLAGVLVQQYYNFVLFVDLMQKHQQQCYLIQLCLLVMLIYHQLRLLFQLCLIIKPDDL